MPCGWAGEPPITVWWRVPGCRSPIVWQPRGGWRSTRCSLAGERRFSRPGPCPFRCLPRESGSPSAGRYCSPSAAYGARDGASADVVARRGVRRVRHRRRRLLVAPPDRYGLHAQGADWVGGLPPARFERSRNLHCPDPGLVLEARAPPPTRRLVGGRPRTVRVLRPVGRTGHAGATLDGTATLRPDQRPELGPGLVAPARSVVDDGSQYRLVLGGRVRAPDRSDRLSGRPGTELPDGRALRCRRRFR